jgi:hypothetical protein
VRCRVDSACRSWRREKRLGTVEQQKSALPHGDAIFPELRLAKRKDTSISLLLRLWKPLRAKLHAPPVAPSSSALHIGTCTLQIRANVQDNQHNAWVSMSRTLPTHLSHKSALVLLPRPTIYPPIEAVRRVHDKHFARWLPHVNLLYPFLALPSDTIRLGNGNRVSQLKPSIRARIQTAVKSLEPFHASLKADAVGVFSHAPMRETVWLDVSTPSVHQLQAALQAEFTECNADQRPYTPHLSVGQANSVRGAQHIGEKIKSSMTGYLRPKDGAPAAWGWYVDKIFVLERAGYHDRFEVVGNIRLGNKQQ